VPVLTPGNDRTSASSSQPQFIRSYDDTFEVGILIKNNWDGMLWKKDVASGTYGSLFNLNTIVGNPFNMPVNSVDSHWTLTCVLDTLNNVHVMGNTHATDWFYAYTNVTNWPPSTTWTVPAFNTLPWNNTGLKLHTYTYFTRMLDGTVIQFSDQEDSAVDTTAGRDFTAWKLPPGSLTWQPLASNGEFMITAGNQTLNNGIPDRAYLYGIATFILPNGTERLGVVAIWAKRDPADTFLKRNLLYAYTDDLGITWKAVDGTVLTMPLDWNNYGPAAITSSPTWSENGSAGFCYDSSGFPHCIAQNRDISSPMWLELYWNGTAWTSRNVPIQGAGASIGPGIFSLKNELFYVTTAFNAMRIRNVVTGNQFGIGGPAWNGCKPVPEPVGMRDRSRLSFLIPNGDSPLVYDVGANTLPKAPG